MHERAREATSGAAAPAVVVLAGVIAAMHVGKAPAALGTIGDAFAMTLVASSYLVSILQLASASLGLFGGLIAERIGLRRAMIGGLCVLGLASLAGARATSPFALLATRACESLGFLMAVLPGPALIARVAPRRAAVSWLGAWGAYMPTGFALTLLATPLMIAASGWRAAWGVAGVAALAAAAAVAWRIPGDGSGAATPLPGVREVGRRAARTLACGGPWLLAALFGVYAAQYLAVFAFLPTIYAQAQIAPAQAGALTAFAAGINAFGNVAGGALMRRGVPAPLTIALASVAMGTGAWVAIGSELPFALRYVAVVVQSVLAGTIPGTLFACVPRHAPGADTMGTTVGLMQQGSGLGQVLLPPLIAWLATSAGGWPLAAQGLAVLAAINVVLALALSRYERRRFGAGGR